MRNIPILIELNNISMLRKKLDNRVIMNRDLAVEVSLTVFMACMISAYSTWSFCLFHRVVRFLEYAEETVMSRVVQNPVSKPMA